MYYARGCHSIGRNLPEDDRYLYASLSLSRYPLHKQNATRYIHYSSNSKAQSTPSTIQDPTSWP